MVTDVPQKTSSQIVWWEMERKHTLVGLLNIMCLDCWRFLFLYFGFRQLKYFCLSAWWAADLHDVQHFPCSVRLQKHGALLHDRRSLAVERSHYDLHVIYPHLVLGGKRRVNCRNRPFVFSHSGWVSEGQADIQAVMITDSTFSFLVFSYAAVSAGVCYLVKSLSVAQQEQKPQCSAPETQLNGLHIAHSAAPASEVGHV